MKYIYTPIIIVFLAPSQAQELVPLDQLLKQSEQRQEIINERLMPSGDGRIPVNIVPAALPKNASSKHCFPVRELVLKSIDKSPLVTGFSANLTNIVKTEGLLLKKRSATTYDLTVSPAQAVSAKAKKSSNVSEAPCLTAEKIQRISTKLQNKIVTKGYITSRVLIPNQNLNQGTLELGIAVGRVSAVEVDKKSIETTRAHRANVYTAFPTKKGKALNLRDLEQGLENLRSVPTVKAEMDIVPGKTPNTSDIAVKWKQRKVPLRLNLSVDDSGGDSTGKYLGTVSLSWDNPLRLNDIVSVSYTKNLSNGTTYTDPQGSTDAGGTHNYSVNYQVPLGYWSISANYSKYRYEQIVAGINRNYHYAGNSNQASIDVSNVLYRDEQHKITARIGGWFKQSKNYIDDVEIDVQRRQTGGWKASLAQRSYFKHGTLSSSLSYKRGTRAFGAIAAPEELFDEGTGKMKIWTADINWQMPFSLGKENFSWSSKFHGQLNDTKLTAQDKISIGGRNSVRGFSGDKTLSAERGWYLRNDIAWQYTDNHKVYLGLDIGHVFGESAKELSGKTLSGAALGLEGRYKYHGDWSYNVFIGKPLQEPEGFDADDVVSGINISYGY